MQALNFPRRYVFDTRALRGATQIFCLVRHKYVALTPEEWVRQHVLHLLTEDAGCPRGLTAVEAAFAYRSRTMRADVTVYDRDVRPLLMVECKAPGVAITQKTFDQLARYSRVIQARYLAATNGLTHYSYRMDLRGDDHQFLPQLPRYEEMLTDPPCGVSSE